MEKLIEVKGVSKRYGETVALSKISFDVLKGEIIGFLGPNAAGKTTTMKILTCFLFADEGDAFVSGFNVLEDPIEVKKRVGYLPENNPLYPDMEVKDYLNFVLEARGLKKKKSLERINEVVEKCGLKSVFMKNIGELSKGYRQRVGLAAALIHDPEILLLDEPTAGLDPKQTLEIRELIKQIAKEKAIMMSTHILSEVSATCSRIIIINAGKIVGEGTPQSLASAEKGEEIIYSSIKAPKDVIDEKLKSWELIKDISFEGIKEEANCYKLNFGNIKNASENFFKFAVENNWILTELKKETISLEDVFLKLTKNNL